MNIRFNVASLALSALALALGLVACISVPSDAIKVSSGLVLRE